MGINVNELYPSRWMKVGVDHEMGDRFNATINTVGLEQFDNGDQALFLSFQDHEKELRLNKTMTKVLASLFGPDTDDWEGQAITIFTTEVTYGSDTYEVYRISNKRPKAAKGKAPKAEAVAEAEAEPF